MIKVLLADDERRALVSLKKIIPWEELKLDLVGTAQNGIALLQEIQEQTPDIVITDICMPGLDGLEVIARTLESGLSVKFIITSAYANFDYARTAFKLGVEDFLPKPIKRTELMETLKRVSEKLDKSALQKNAYSCIIRTAKEYIEKNYQKRLTLEEVAGNSYVSPNYLSMLFRREMNIHFSEYLSNIRLENSVKLLDDISLSVSDVAQMVGYKDVGHFNSIFMKKYGVTPAKYRRSSGAIQNR